MISLQLIWVLGTFASVHQGPIMDIFVKIMAWWLFSTKPLSDPMLAFRLDGWEQINMNLCQNLNTFIEEKLLKKSRPQNGCHFVSASESLGVMHICIRKLNNLWLRSWLVPYSMPSHDLKQCWLIHWTIANKFQSNFCWNSHIFIQEKLFVKVHCRMAAILSQPQCVNPSWLCNFPFSSGKNDSGGNGQTRY